MKKIFVILAMLVAINASAQWVQTSRPYSGNIGGSLLNIGNDIYTGIFGPGIFYTSNNGSNWINITNNSNNSIHTIACNKNYLFTGAYGPGPNAPIFRSSDTGQTWVNIGNSILDELVSNMFTKGDTVFASVWSLKKQNMNNTTLHFSTNNGNNWLTSQMYNGLSGFVTAGASMFICNGYGVFKSSNCINWIKVNSGLSDTSISSLAYDEINNIMYAGSVNHGIFTSTNYGDNWFAKSTGIENSGINAMKIIGNVVIAGTGFGVYKSTNFGMSWILMGLSSLSIASIACNDDYIFASTTYNSIWRRPLSEMIGIQNISAETPSSYSLSQNYPNPFNSTSNLKFQIVNTGNVKLIVYDILGKEVQTLVNERLQPGTYEVSFDGSALNSGVYFYKLTTDGFTETKKMLLIK